MSNPQRIGIPDGNPAPRPTHCAGASLMVDRAGYRALERGGVRWGTRSDELPLDGKGPARLASAWYSTDATTRDAFVTTTFTPAPTRTTPGTRWSVAGRGREGPQSAPGRPRSRSWPREAGGVASGAPEAASRN